MGGIHPPENKLSSEYSIRNIEIPEKVVIPLSQHIGAPAKPIVAKGDVVKVGQQIAEGQGFVSASLHAPVSGKILKIDNEIDSSGYKRPSILINVEGDEWDESIDRSPELCLDFDLSREEIIERIQKAGIVGLGGATFPSHVKLSIPRGKVAEYLVINGVECEPYLTSDHVLMLEKGEEIIVGTRILMKALGVEKALIGIEINKHDAIEHLMQLTKHQPEIEIHPLQVKYPQGGEKQLIEALIKREVPSGGLPIDVGVVAFNVGTTFAVYEAIQKNKPLFERIVTVTGEVIKNPSNFRVRIGTPIAHIIDAAGGMGGNAGKIISGGPMMGKALSSIDIPVTKGSSGVLVFPQEDSKRKDTRNCIRCSKCISVCPMGLEPYLLMALSQRQMLERLENEKILDCIECGSCSYICPANRPLLDFIRLAKPKVLQSIRKRKK